MIKQKPNPVATRRVLFIISALLTLSIIGISSLHFYDAKSRLTEILLKKGGTQIEEADAKVRNFIYRELVEKGTWITGPVVMVGGKSGQCFQNSKDFVSANPDHGFAVYRGYALWGDEWSYHGWVLTPDGKIFEMTNIQREYYFGVLFKEEKK